MAINPGSASRSGDDLSRVVAGARPGQPAAPAQVARRKRDDPRDQSTNDIGAARDAADGGRARAGARRSQQHPHGVQHPTGGSDEHRGWLRSSARLLGFDRYLRPGGARIGNRARSRAPPSRLESLGRRAPRRSRSRRDYGPPTKRCYWVVSWNSCLAGSDCLRCSQGIAPGRRNILPWGIGSIADRTIRA